MNPKTPYRYAVFRILSFVLMFALPWFLPAPGLAGDTPFKVKTFDVLPHGIADSIPHGFARIGNTLYFSATDAEHGCELWKTDGTSAGTTLVKDVSPDTTSSQPASLTPAGGTLFFTADDGAHGVELWKSDGTPAGTVLVRDVAPGATSSQPASLNVVGGVLFFTASDGAHGTELWKSDGTPAGTVMVRDIHPAGKSAPANLTALDGILYFSAEDGAHGIELWRSDGTSAGTSMLKDINTSTSSLPARLTVSGNRLFFTASGNPGAYGLWVSDGTAAGTTMVKSGLALYLTDLNGMLYFAAPGALDDSGVPFDLWQSDGTSAGTVLVRQMHIAYDHVHPERHRFIENANGTLYIGSQYRELWKSDGTAAGTVLLASWFDEPPFGFTAVGSRALFIVSSDWEDYAAGECSIGVTDGTAAGTDWIKDATSAPYLGPLVLLNGRAYFPAWGDGTGIELWSSDGSAAGTSLVADIHKPLYASLPDVCRDINGTFFFALSDRSAGTVLWKSDASAAGTAPVHTVSSQVASPWLNSTWLCNVGGQTYFSAVTDTGGQLWKMNGTAAPSLVISRTTWLADCLAALDGDLYLFSTNLTCDALYRSDGTSAGTAMIRLLIPDPAASGKPAGGLQANEAARKPQYLGGPTPPLTPNLVTVMNGRMYFFAFARGAGWKLWTSDGTASGTKLIDSVSAEPKKMVAVGQTLYYATTVLYRSDGTTSDSTALKGRLNVGMSPQMCAMNGILYFAASDTTHGIELWRSDGTDAGTFMVKEIRPGAGYSSVTNLCASGGVLYFSADDGSHGQELWRSDGTESGTVMVADIRPGPAGSSPHGLADVFGQPCFVADDGVHGAELWTSGGTARTTRLVSDLLPGWKGSNPVSLTVSGRYLYFFPYGMNTTATTQLWALDVPANGVRDWAWYR